MYESLYCRATSTAVAALAPIDVDRPMVERLLVSVQMTHERLQAALEVEGALAVATFVDERDPDALVQVRGFAQTLADRVELVVDRLEHLRVGPEAGAGALPGPLRAELLDRSERLAAPVLLRPDMTVTRGFDAHPLGQGVHDTHADAVQPAGDLVSAATELAAGMEDRVDDLHGVLAGRVLADRHAAAVVLDDDRPVSLDRHLDHRRMAGHRLVDRVVDDFPDQVMEAAGIGRADIHARTASNRFEALEDLDRRGRVVGSTRLGAPWLRRGGGRLGGGRGAGGFVGHAVPPVRRSYRRPNSSSL